MTRRRSPYRYGLQRAGLGQWIDRGDYAGKSWQARKDYFGVLASVLLRVCVVCFEALTEEDLNAGELMHAACDPTSAEYYRSGPGRREDRTQRREEVIMSTFTRDWAEAEAIAQAIDRNEDLQRRADALAREHGWSDRQAFLDWQRKENTRRYAAEIEQQQRDRDELAELIDRRARPWAYRDNPPKLKERPYGNLSTFDGRTLRSVDTQRRR